MTRTALDARTYYLGRVYVVGAHAEEFRGALREFPRATPVSDELDKTLPSSSLDVHLSFVVRSGRSRRASSAVSARDFSRPDGLPSSTVDKSRRVLRSP